MITTATLYSMPNSRTISLPAPTICAIRYRAMMVSEALAARMRIFFWPRRKAVTSAKLKRPRLRRRSATRNRSEEHTSELQSRENLVCRLLLEKKKLKILNEPIVELKYQLYPFLNIFNASTI